VAKGDLEYNVGLNVDLADIQRLAAALATGGVNAARAFNAALGGTVTKQIVFETRADDNGIKRLVAVEKERLSVADAYINKLNQIGKIQEGSATSLRQQVNQAKQARDEIARYEQKVGVLGGKVNSITPAWAAQNAKLQELQRSLDKANASGFWAKVKTDFNAQGLFNFANGLTEITVGLQSASIIVGQVIGSVNGLINALGDLQSFGLAFEAVGQGAGGAGIALAESSRIALGLGVDLKTVRQGFQQLTPVILNTGGTIGDVSNIVEALSSRFAAFGISGDRARRVTNGIIQAFAKGKLQAEELTQQISEADPAFKTDFAGALKVTVAQLEELVKAGEVTGEVLLKYLPEVGRSELLFGRLGTSAVDAADSLRTTGTTVDQVRAKLSTISQLSFEEFAKSIEPVLFGFLRFGAVITDSLARISKLQGIDALGAVGGKLLESFSRLAEALLSTAEAGLIIVDVVAKIAAAFASVPGVTDIVAVAIAGKLIAPLASLKAAFGKSIGDATIWGRSIRAVTTFPGLKQAFSDIRSSIGNLFTGANSSSAALAKLNTEQTKLAAKSAMTQAAIGRVTSKLEGYKSVVAGLRNLPNFGGDPTIQRSVDNYTKKIIQARTQLGILQNSLGQVTGAQDANSAAITAATTKTNIFQRSINGLRGTFNAVGNAGARFVTLLGPLGTALAAIAVFTSAYRTATQSSNAILEESKGRVDALKAALKDLGGETGRQKEPVTGLALVWQQFSFLVLDAVNTTKSVLDNLFKGFAPKAKEAATGIAGVIDQVGRFLAVAGTGALAGALIFGGLSGGTLAPVGAAIGTVVASIAAFAAGAGEASVQTRKLQGEVAAAGTAIENEANAIRGLLAGITKGGTIKIDINNAGALAAFRQAETALDSLKKNIDGLKNQKIRLQYEASTQKPGQEFLDAYAAVEKAQLRVAATSAEIQRLQKAGISRPPSLINQWQREQVAVVRLRDALEELKKADPDSGRYLELQTQVKNLNREISESEAIFKAAQAEYDALAVASGLLTSEQKKTIPTIAGLNEKLKALQTTLETDINPNSNPEKWREVSAAIGRTTVELTNLQDKADDSTGNEIIYTIKTKINSREIANSLANAQRLVQALEQRATVVDISSPSLPNVLRDLFNAKSQLDQLNGRRAEITISIIEQSLGGNLTAASLSQLDLYLQQLEQRKVTIPISSQGIDEVIVKINEVSALRDAANKSSAELERTLTQQIFSERAQRIREEQSLQNEVFNERIARLQELGPAEQALAKLREDELRERASSGDLEATAQLERIERQKEIKRLTDEQKANEKKVENELKQIADQERKAQEAARKVELEAAQKILEARRGGKLLLEESLEPAKGIASQLGQAAIDAERIAAAFKSLNGFTAQVKVTSSPSRWTGGPTQAGQTYQVNELGQEGFLSAGGSLRPINKPKNALWRAPSSGTVIPAHIWSGLDVPTGGVRTNVRPMAAGSGGNGLQRVVRAIQSSLTQPRESNQAMHELTAVQARQAIEIGKLSRAVNKLADKDHNVNVSVRNTGGTAYLQALNRSL
jgi:tape measure domain-containing protein